MTGRKGFDVKKEKRSIYFRMSLEELMDEYEASRGHPQSPLTLELIMSEIWRKNADRISKRIYWLTIIITIFTFSSLVLMVCSLFKIF